MNVKVQFSESQTTILKGYVHRPGFHCVTSAMRDVFEFHGLNLSEEMVFGLGSGLSLGYINFPGMSDPMVGGRSGSPDEVFCKRLGIKLSKFSTKDSKKGWLKLKNRIDNRIPSMIMIDMAYLPYMELPDDFHFGQHSIVVCGYDQKFDIVYVSDTSLEEIQQIPVKLLGKGRSSIHNKWMDPNNMIHEFSFPSEYPEMKEIIPKSLNEAGKNILKSPRIMGFVGVTSGLKSIDKLTKDIPKWIDLPLERLFYRCFMISGYISDFGTGGGHFRYLYSRFLDECSSILEDNKLKELSKLYKKIGDQWEKVSQLFKQVSTNVSDYIEIESIFQNIVQILPEIKKIEFQGAHQLEKY